MDIGKAERIATFIALLKYEREEEDVVVHANRLEVVRKMRQGRMTSNVDVEICNVIERT